MRCCRLTRLESMRGERGAGPPANRVESPILVRTAFELDEKVNRLHKFNLFVVGETDNDLVIFLRDVQVFATNRADRILDVLLPLERGANFGYGRAFSGDLVDRPLDREVLVQRR